MLWGKLFVRDNLDHSGWLQQQLSLGMRNVWMLIAASSVSTSVLVSHASLVKTEVEVNNLKNNIINNLEVYFLFLVEDSC